MRKSLSLIILLGLLCATAVFPQAKGKTTTQLPQVEPFKIGRGGSFAASASRPLTETAKAPGASAAEAISSDFSEALAIIRENHVNGASTDYNELAKSSISSMLRTLDPHSNYFDSDEWRELMEDQRSEYFGIGATIVNYEKDHEVDTYIVSTFPDSPASQGQPAVRR